MLPLLHMLVPVTLLLSGIWHFSSTGNAILAICLQVAPDSISFIVSCIMSYSWNCVAEYVVPDTVKLCVSFFYPGDLWTGDLHMLEPCCKVVRAILMPARLYVSLTHCSFTCLISLALLPHTS